MPTMVGVIADSYNKPAPSGGGPPVTGYAAWFDADDASSFTFHSGTTVLQWNDKSGNGYHVIQAYTPYSPTRNGTQNGKTTVVYSGVSQGLDRTASSFAAVTDNFTMFAVFKKIGTEGDGRTLFANGTTGNGCAIAATAYSSGNVGFLIGGVNWYNGGRPSTGAYQVVVLRRTSGVWSMHSNGTAGTITGSPGGISTPTGASLSNPTHPFKGELAETIFYNSALNDTNRSSVEEYLITKWGLISKVWDGTTPASTVDTGRYNLGTFFSLFSPIIVRGVRIWNPGLVNTQTTYSEDRVANLWTHNGTGGSAVLRASVDLPDQLPTGWSEYLFPTPYSASTGVNYCISYSCHGSGSNADYGAVSSAFPSVYDRSPVRYEANGGAFVVAAPGAACPNGTGTTFYGVDLLYT